MNTSGGYEKQIVIQPDPARLAASGLSLDQLAEIVEQNTRNAGGGYIEIGGEQLIVRAASRVSSLEEIAKLPLKFAGGIRPILLNEVATVSIGSDFRAGASTDDGVEALVGAAIMLVGENSRLVAKAVREKRDLLVSNATLPEGEGYQVVVQVKPTADAKPKNFRLKLLTYICGGCSNPEYACTCDE